MGNEAALSPCQSPQFLTLEGPKPMTTAYEPKNILITGGAGFIASHVAEHLFFKYPKYKILDKDSEFRHAPHLKGRILVGICLRSDSDAGFKLPLSTCMSTSLPKAPGPFCRSAMRRSQMHLTEDCDFGSPGLLCEHQELWVNGREAGHQDLSWCSSPT